MIWLILGEASHQIIACNIHEENNLFQLWVTRANGKTMKIQEHADKNEIIFVKEAIDYAIENGEKALKIS